MGAISLGSSAHERGRNATLIGGIALSICLLQIIFFTSLARWLVPLPLILLVPAMYLSHVLDPTGAMGGIIFYFPYIPIALFWGLGWKLFRGEASTPLFALVAALVLAGLNILYIYYAWSYGIVWQGTTTTIVLSVESIVGSFVVLGLIVRNRRCPTFRTNFAGHWSLAFWVGWFAFPQFGEWA